MRIVAIEQGTHEWFEWRREHSMASETAAVMGKSPYESPLMVAESKLYGAQKLDNEHMRRGREREPILRKLASEAYGVAFEPACVEDGTLAASLDGFNLSSMILCEIKSPAGGEASNLYQAALAGKLPEHYSLQVQHQLMVTGAHTAAFVVDGGPKGVPAFCNVNPDPAMWKSIRKAWDAFWATLASGAMPEPSQLDEVVRDDPDWIQAALRFRAAKNQLEQAQDVLDKAKAALIYLSLAPRTRGGGVQLTRFRRAGRVQYSKVPQLEGVDLAPFRSPPTDEIRVTIVKEKP